MPSPTVTPGWHQDGPSRTPRRGAAAAGPTPASTMRRLRRRAASQGHLPASCRPAVSTRVHQCGGSPIHHAPARRADHRARPPPDLAGSHTSNTSPRPPPLASSHAQDHAIYQRKPSPRQAAPHQYCRPEVQSDGLGRSYVPCAESGGMPKSAAYEIELGGDERAELEHRAACYTLSFRQVRRARLVLAKITESEPRLALAA
jgi:hypothetical protein